jgi:tryptophanyl-tRNA synthetase
MIRADKAPEEVSPENLKSLQNSINNLEAKSAIHEKKFNELTHHVKALSEFYSTRDQQTQANAIVSIYKLMSENPDLSQKVKQECRKLALEQLSRLINTASPTGAILACSALHELNMLEELPDSPDLRMCRELAQKLNRDFNKNIEHNT